MARRVRNSNLESRSAREKLTKRGEPYYKGIDKGLHVGYRKGENAAVWVMRTYVGDGNYHVKSIGSADDLLDADGTEILNWWQAVDKARQLRAAQTAAGSTKRGPYTVGDALDAYLVHAKQRQKAYRSSENAIEKLIRPEFGDKLAAELTSKEIRDWHNKLADTPRRLRTKPGAEQRFVSGPMNDEAKRQRRSTANRVLTVLKAALNLAFREEHVPDDKAWRRVEAFEDVDSARLHYLTVAEAQRVINASEPDFRNLVQAALQTGCRYGELTRLRVRDFNAATGKLAINETKTGKPRHIILTDEGQTFFAGLVAGRESDALMMTKGDSSAWGDSHQSRPMVAACKRAKITPLIGFHGLRHTWASLSVMNGMPLMVVAANLGHVDTRMVEKHYGHLAPSYVAEAVRANAPRFGTVEESNVKAIA